MNTIHVKDAPAELLKELQSGLKALGLYSGEVDGVYGEKTLSAWKSWKQKMYLSDVEKIGSTSLDTFRQDFKKHPLPTDGKAIAAASRTAVVPGISKAIAAGDPIYAGSNFTWGEATKNLERLPKTQKETENIVRMARYMDEARKFLGDRSIIVTSWFRPEPFNRRVGGVRNSLHTTGLAVDFVVKGQTPSQTQKAIDNWHGDRGGLGYGRTFTHIDLRGFRARFNY